MSDTPAGVRQALAQASVALDRLEEQNRDWRASVNVMLGLAAQLKTMADSAASADASALALRTQADDLLARAVSVWLRDVRPVGA